MTRGLLLSVLWGATACFLAGIVLDAWFDQLSDPAKVTIAVVAGVVAMLGSAWLRDRRRARL